jgi:hypothetical protein
MESRSHRSFAYTAHCETICIIVKIYVQNHSDEAHRNLLKSVCEWFTITSKGMSVGLVLPHHFLICWDGDSNLVLDSTTSRHLRGGGRSPLGFDLRNGSDSQLWRYDLMTRAFISVASENAIDVGSASLPGETTEIILWPPHGRLNQQWDYDPMTHQILSAMHPLALAIKDDGTLYVSQANENDTRQFVLFDLSGQQVRHRAVVPANQWRRETAPAVPLRAPEQSPPATRSLSIAPFAPPSRPSEFEGQQPPPGYARVPDPIAELLFGRSSILDH